MLDEFGYNTHLLKSVIQTVSAIYLIQLFLKQKFALYLTLFTTPFIIIRI